VNDELERIVKRRSSHMFKVLAGHSTGGTEESQETISQDSQSPGRDLNPEAPEYEAGVLTTRPRRSVTHHIE
jgi:hypothetical protein